MEKLGQIFIKLSFINPSQLEEALTCQGKRHQQIGQLLVELGYLNEEQLAQGLSHQLGLPYLQPLELSLEAELLNAISPRQAEKYQVVPVALNKDRLTIATYDPLNLDSLDTLRSLVRYKLKLAVASESQIKQTLKKYYSGSLESVASVLEDLDEAELSQYQALETGNISSIASENMVNEAPIIRLVNTIIAEAVKVGASDIHLEPFEDEIKVRYRVDGVLQETAPPPWSLFPAVISRIKLMAGMDITERRLPQDGRIRVRLNNRDFDLRVAVAPTIYGEAAVLRILNRESIMLGLEQLGMSPQILDLFVKLIMKPHGMVLVTGPTGSGKTTTLYAGLQRLNESVRKIITVEDPVEYQLKGINQMQVNPKVDFTFAQGLRTIVRHDPDVILVGEIRDRETAEIAIQSALTGHLVLATLHTNDASTAFTRLIDMGVEEFLVASTVRGVLAQRLVRKVCPYCQTSYTPNNFEREILGEIDAEKLVIGSGCEKCNQIGYRGQIGIYELLVNNEEIERLVMERATARTIREAGLAEGMQTLRADGLLKVKLGLTTIAEILRVTQD